MTFVGRIRETDKIIRCLNRRENIILTGSYGIGRTSLIRNVADLLKTEWNFSFVDFSKTPGEMAHKIASKLILPKQKKLNPYPFKKKRSLLIHGNIVDSRRPVIVLDNIASLTNQKISFLNHIVFEKKFSFIAIAESSLAGESLFRLRSSLFPAQLIRLGYLNRKNIIELFRILAELHGLDWEKSHIDNLASSMKGYPLSINEIITRGIENKKKTDRKCNQIA